VADRGPLIALVTAVLLGAWLAWEFTREPAAVAPADDVASAELAELPPLDLEFEQPDLLDFQATLDRPLFNEDRQPDELVATAGEEPGEVPQAARVPLRLSAIISDAEGRSALLQQPGAETPQRVHEGERIAGWTVLEISDEAVVLGSGEQRSEIPLRVFEAAPPPRPVAARPPARSARTAVQPRRPPLARSQLQVDEDEQDRRDGEDRPRPNDD
jgi:hypothetical protein